MAAVREKAKSANAVVESDNDNAVVGGAHEACAIVVGVGVGVEAAALDEDKYGQPRGRRSVRRSVDIEEEAVLRVRGKCCTAGRLVGA